jgi:AcrR family transcriptional regulator
MSPRPDVSEERKNQILQAAMTIFSRMGFHDARMDDIVVESGLSKGTLYWYFNSKDEIIIAILDHLFGRELRAMKELVEAPGTARQRLLFFMEHSITEMRQMQRLMPLTYEFYALAFRHEAVRTAMQHYLRSYLDILEPLIQQGMDRGEFLPGDAHRVALATGAIFEGSLLLWIYDPQLVDWEAQVRAGADLLLRGMECTTER